MWNNLAPPGRGITPVRREAAFQPAEDGRQRRVLLARVRLRGNRANCAASEEHFPSAAWLRIPAALFPFVFPSAPHICSWEVLTVKSVITQTSR